MNALPWLAVLALQAVAFAGCLDTSAETIFAVDEPRIGDTYRYAGSDGSVLTARVAESAANRTDALGRVHAAMIINWTIEWPDLDVSFYFEEALDPGLGLIIQQAAHCAIWYIDESLGDSPICWDDRVRLMFGATGYPGGFGAGPFWQGVPDLNGAAKVSTYSQFANRTHIAYDVEPEEAPGCFRLQGQRDPEPVAMLPQSAIWGPIVLCEEHSLPVEFRGVGLPPAFVAPENSSTEVQYVLEEAIRGDAEARTSRSGNIWATAGSSLPTPEWDNPFFVVGHEEPVPFTLAEAHAAAMDVEEYRALVEGPSSTMLLDYRLSPGGHSKSPPLNETRNFELTFKVVNSAGQGLSVVVTKRITEHYPIPPLRNGSTEEKVEIASASTFTADGPATPATISLNQARLGEALERGEALTGQPYDDETLKISFEPSGHGWSLSKSPPRSDGYEIVVRYPEPNKPASGFVRTFPFTAAFDGPTGSTIMFDRPNDQTPY